MKLDKKYLLNSIEEVLRIASLEECLESLGSENMKVTVAPLSEIIENVGNFGAESRGDGLLNEAWDSYWPEAFNDMRDEIKELTNKGVRAEDLISKYFLEAVEWFYFNPDSIWERYRDMFGSFAYAFFDEDPQKLKAAMKFIDDIKGFDEKEGLAQTNKMWDKIRRERREGMKKLAFLSKLIKSLSKKVSRFAKAVDADEKFEKTFQEEIKRTLMFRMYKDIDQASFDIEDIVKFINKDEGDGNLKKLAAFYKKAKNDPEVGNIVQATRIFIEDEFFELDMTPCDENTPDGDGCLFHKFDDGYFWHAVNGNSCSVSARKMNNCGQAEVDDSILYNLMSMNEDGNPNWHVMVEWNRRNQMIVQVLGKNNKVPKEKYWDKIKWFYEFFGEPTLNEYAWDNLEGREAEEEVNNLLKYLGLKSDEPITETWSKMTNQINDGFYNSKTYEGTFSNFAKAGGINTNWGHLIFSIEDVTPQNVTLRGRIQIVTIAQPLMKTDGRKYKDAAKKFQETFYNDFLKDILNPDINDFFDFEDRLRVRTGLSNTGKLVISFSVSSKLLQDNDDGRSSKEYRDQIEREYLSSIMKLTQKIFTPSRLMIIGKTVADQIKKTKINENKIISKLDKKYLTSVILEVLKEHKQK